MNIRKLIESELSKLTEKQKRKLLQDLEEKASPGKISKAYDELSKITQLLLQNLEKFKSAKGDDKEKYKKVASELTKKKKKAESNLEKLLQSMHKDIKLDPAFEGRIKEMFSEEYDRLIEKRLGKGKKVTKQWWKKASEDDRERAMLSVVKDPDDIDYDLVDGKWENLEGWMQRDMYFFEGKSEWSKMNSNESEKLTEKGKGLWHNIRAKRARGEAPAKKGSKAYKKAKKAADDIKASEGVIKERTAKATLEDAVKALMKTIGGKKLDQRYVKDYLKSMERLARKKPMDFVKDYGDFSVADWIEDVKYNLQNEGAYGWQTMDMSSFKGLKTAKKGAKAKGGGYGPFIKITGDSWKNPKTGRLMHSKALASHIGGFDDFIIEGKLTEDFSQRARNFRVNLRMRMKDLKIGGKIIAYKMTFTKEGPDKWSWKGSQKWTSEAVVKKIKLAAVKDIMKWKQGASGAPMVNAFLKFEGKVNEATNLWKHFDAKMKLQDTIMDLEYDMKMITKDIAQLHKDMEQEAEPEGGKVATRYGRDIEKKEKEYKKKKAEFKKLMAKLEKMEQY